MNIHLRPSKNFLGLQNRNNVFCNSWIYGPTLIRRHLISVYLTRLSTVTAVPDDSILLDVNL
jgi:hypothetical protein